MSRKTKVAIVLPYFGTGGAEKMVCQLSCALDPQAFETEVFCVYGQPQHNHMEQALLDRGIRIHFIGKKKGPSVSAVFRLFRQLDAFGPDVVHTHLYACVYAALWPVVRRKPFLHTFHTLPEVENRRWLRRQLTTFLVKQGKLHPVAISRENRKLIADFYHLSETVVPIVHNPVDLLQFSGEKRTHKTPMTFLTAGRFTAVKNQQLMYHAFAAFLAKGYDARLVMLGAGEEEANLKALAHRLGIHDRIVYPGFVVNVQEYLAKADVFLLSSHYEAQPLSILEAMASALPVISTDVGGVRDIVTDNGILVPPGDAAAMAQAMEQLYTDAALYHSLSANSGNNVQAFDIHHTAEGYAGLYRFHARLPQE